MSNLTGLMARRAFVWLMVVEALMAVLVAVALPLSAGSLLSVVAVLLMLNALAILEVTGKAWALSLQVGSVLAAAAGLTLVLEYGRAPLSTSVLFIAVMHSALLVSGLLRVSDRTMRWCFASLQFTLSSVLIAWALIVQVDQGVSAEQVLPDHLRMGMRFLLSGPLMLVPVVFVASRTGWQKYLIGWAGVCVGQYAAGLIDVGMQLELALVVGVGFVMSALFLVLLALTAVPISRMAAQVK